MIRFVTDFSQIAFNYLEAVSVFPCKVLPLGPCFINDPPWAKFAHLFTNRLDHYKFNIVCAPASLWTPPFYNEKDGQKVCVKEAESVFENMFDSSFDVRNVALISNAKEIEKIVSILKAYDLVVEIHGEGQRFPDSEVLTPEEFYSTILLAS